MDGWSLRRRPVRTGRPGRRVRRLPRAGRRAGVAEADAVEAGRGRLELPWRWRRGAPGVLDHVQRVAPLDHDGEDALGRAAAALGVVEVNAHGLVAVDGRLGQPRGRDAGT